MSRTGISAALAAFVVLTVVLGASTAYLLASPTVHTSTTTSTLVSVSSSTQTMFLTTTSTLIQTTTSVLGSTGYTVGIAYKQGIGFYLVDGSGMTLYFRTADIHSNGTSTCVGQCVNFWPVFFTQNLVLPPGLNASSFTVVTRADGMKQIDYNNWPLYHFSGDNNPGDTNGQGTGGIWFAYALPAPSQVTTSSTSSTTTTPSTSTLATSSTATATSTSTTSTSSTDTTASSSTTTSTTTTTSSSSTCTYYC
ncbi:MAG TPA: hypothetical protein VKF39_06250 [Nitrososphaerales archaeon]|nr:hypothetical protein [Nitrososphaerales archaeon]